VARDDRRGCSRRRRDQLRRRNDDPSRVPLPRPTGARAPSRAVRDSAAARGLTHIRRSNRIVEVVSPLRVPSASISRRSRVLPFGRRGTS
jgi:hypothetical protein